MTMETKKYIGTIGHIDHGKTSLTAAITKVLADADKAKAMTMENDLVERLTRERDEALALVNYAEDISKTQEVRIQALEAELAAARDDTERLDYLDSLNASLNARYGTKYAWSMVVNGNVNRVMFNFPQGADLSDYNPNGFGSCRGAIDQRMAETAASRRAARSALEEKTDV